MNRNKIRLSLAMVSLLALSAAPSFAQGSGLFIDLPGQKQIEKASATVKIDNKIDAKNPKKTRKSSDPLISLPQTIKPKQAEPVKDPEENEKDKDKEKPLIKIETPKPVEIPVPAGDFPVPPDEVVISSGDSLGDLLPAPPPPEVPTASGTDASQTMPIFPKDTSSAIFMVMKTWQCDNYDGNTLLTHALEVYGKEADDVFQIQGLSAPDTGDFMVTVEEEDITLDELLDILAAKSGRDWGVDIPSKTIYFYPKGVKTETFNVW